tara:strand:+ start:938 stop:1150 length:213 start_codon:yes stop_codon:yes gene_type:complete
MFKTHKNKTFNFSSRYYDERKERLEKLKNGESDRIKFKSNKKLNLTKARTIRLLLIVVALFCIATLVLFK